MFLTYVIKVDKREALKLYFKHICVVSLFLDFPGKLGKCHFLSRGGPLDIFQVL